MPEDRAALLRHYREMRESMAEAIAGLSDAQMTETTIDGWSVKDHLAHIALWDDIRAQEVRRISAGFESAWKMDGAQDAALNDLATTLRRELSLSQVRWEWTNSRQSLLDAIEVATDRGLDASLYGEAGLVSGHEGQHAGWIRDWRSGRGY